MASTVNILAALRAKDYTTAQEGVSQLLNQKMQAALAQEKRTLGESLLFETAAVTFADVDALFKQVQVKLDAAREKELDHISTQDYPWAAGMTQAQKRDQLSQVNNRNIKLTDRKKYVAVDLVGSGGHFMVDKADGSIYGIKGYGQVHTGHRYGTVAQPQMRAIVTKLMGLWNSRYVTEALKPWSDSGGYGTCPKCKDQRVWLIEDPKTGGDICKVCFNKRYGKEYVIDPKRAAMEEAFNNIPTPPKPQDPKRHVPGAPTDWDKGFNGSDGWQIGAGGTERPFVKNGKWYLYCWNFKTKKHAYYSYKDDTFVDSIDEHCGVCPEDEIKKHLDEDYYVVIASADTGHTLFWTGKKWAHNPREAAEFHDRESAAKEAKKTGKSDAKPKLLHESVMPTSEVQRVYNEVGDVGETELLCGVRSLKVNQNGSVVSFVVNEANDLGLPIKHAGSPLKTNASINRDHAVRMFNAGMTPRDIANAFPAVFKVTDGDKLGQKYDYELGDGSGRLETSRLILKSAVDDAIRKFKAKKK